MRNYGKKAQNMPVSAPSGSGAAIVVFIIAAFIILYLLFLPKTDRENLLGTGPSAIGTTTPGSLPGATLVKENPGVLTAVKESTFDHRIPAFNLFTKKEDIVLKSLGSIHVESSRSDAKKRTVVLAVQDAVENAKLTFTVSDHSGNLVIKQNDNDLFSGEIDSFAEPISLQLDPENTFEFSTDPVPWWKPFSKNFYDIKDIKFTGTVEKLENKEAVQTVILGDEEYNLLSEASLSYFVDCNLKDIGKLDVYVNNRLLASKVPDCGGAEKFQIDPNDLRAGKNEFRFIAQQGTFLLDQMLLRTKLKEAIFPIYFFSINSSTFSRIESNAVNSTLSIRFINNKERKTATIEINNQKTRLDTSSANYSKNVDSFLLDGTNYLRIVPDTTLNIVELKLVLDCKKASECS